MSDKSIAERVAAKFVQASDPWVSAEAMKDICSDCAIKMQASNIRAVRASVILGAWDKLPPGWTEESLKSFWSSLTGDRKGKVTACIKKMEGKVDDPGAFCASLADKISGDTSWRGKGK